MNAAQMPTPATNPLHLVARQTVPARHEEREFAVLALDDQGVIVECDHRGESLFGYACTELVGRPVSMLIPELARVELLQEGQPNARLRYRTRIGHHFQVVPRDGQPFPAILFFNCLDNATAGRLSLIVRRV